ncbi:hypothetical protein SS50377_22042 [Spironucleus salmonicida]|uniref:Uncharacterized protein n=1 Tax=Spironucleus salmonicida TaxID=348837 RepID=V6LNH9_9EUKA|nr:hypothetical protein SS50377_22042 [Spironucleus salmonicida]|eukprot:EST45793.1 Hypothetical protein SS50377_14367 [Spironucleus salmonicida]
MNLLPVDILSTISKIKNLIKRQDLQTNQGQAIILYHQLYESAVDIIAADEQINELYIQFVSYINTEYVKKTFETEICSLYLMKIQFPNPYEYFMFQVLALNDYQIPSENLRIFIDIVIDCKVGDIIRMLAFNILYSPKNYQATNSIFKTLIDKNLDSKNFIKKQRECVPYVQLIPYIFSTKIDEEHLYHLLSGKFDLCQRYVMKTMLSSTISLLVYQSSTQQLLQLVGQNINKVVSWLSDKKHFSAAFVPLVEYAISAPQFLISPNFTKLTIALKANPVQAFPAVIRLITSLCYEVDIFDTKLVQKPLVNSNKYLIDIAILVFQAVSKHFSPKNLQSIQQKMLQFDQPIQQQLSNIKIIYFKFLPYLSMLPADQFFIPQEYILLGSLLVSCDKNLAKRFENNTFVQFVIFSDTQNFDPVCLDIVYQSNIEYFFKLAIIQKDINMYVQSISHLISKNIVQISKADLIVLVKQQIDFSVFYGQELLAVVIQQIKNRQWAIDGIQILQQSLKQCYKLVNNKLIYSLILLYLTDFQSGQDAIDGFIRFTYKKFQSNYPDGLFDSKQSLIQSFISSENIEFENYIDKQIVKDLSQTQTIYSNRILLFYFVNNQQHQQYFIQQFFNNWDEQSALLFSNKYTIFDNITQGSVISIQSAVQDSLQLDYKYQYSNNNIKDMAPNLLESAILQSNTLVLSSNFAQLCTQKLLSIISSSEVQKIIYDLNKSNQQLNLTQLFDFMYQPLFVIAFTALQHNFCLFIQHNKLEYFNNVLLLLTPFLLLLNHIPSLGLFLKQCHVKDESKDKIIISQYKDITSELYMNSIFYLLKDEKLIIFINNIHYKKNFNNFLLQFGYQQLCLFMNNKVIHQYVDYLTFEEKQLQPDKQYKPTQSIQDGIQKLKFLSAIYQYSYVNTYDVFQFITSFYENNLYIFQVYYFEQVVYHILSYLKTNLQYSKFIITIFQFYQNKDPRIPMLFIEKLLQSLIQCIQDNKFSLLTSYDYELSINLEQLFEIEPSLQIPLYCQDASELFDYLKTQPQFDLQYFESVILKQDLAKRASFAFDTLITLDQAQQYFTVSQTLLLVFIIANDARTIQYSKQLIDCLMSSTILSKTWVKSLLQTMQQIDIPPYCLEHYNQILQKSQIFIPGTLWFVGQLKRDYDVYLINFELNGSLKELVCFQIQTFLTFSFCIQIDNFTYKPSQFYETFFENSLQNSDQTSESNTSSSNLSATLNCRQQENYQLSELFLNLYFVLISLYQYPEFESIFVKQILKKFDTIIIIKFMQFYTHNKIFLNTYQLNVSEDLKQRESVQIVEKQKKKIIKKSTNIFVSDTDRQVPFKKQSKQKQKYQISHISEMFETNFDYKLIESIVLRLAVSQQSQIIQELINFTFLDQSYDSINILQFSSQQQEYIYGFVARKLIAKILKQSFQNSIKIEPYLLVTSLVVLSIDGVYTDCFKSDNNSKPSEKSMQQAYQRSEFSVISSSSRKQVKIAHIEQEQQLIQALIQLQVPSFYFFQILLDEKLENLNNITILLQRFLIQPHLLLDYLHILTLQINQLGIISEMQAPWMNPDKFVLTTQFQAKITYSMAIIIDERGVQSAINRTNALTMIQDGLSSQIFKDNFSLLPEDRNQMFIISLFKSYINQMQLLDFNNSDIISQQKIILENIIISILLNVIEKQTIRLVQPFVKMIKVLQYSKISAIFAYKLLYILINHAPQTLIINSSVQFYQTLQNSNFNNCFRFFNAQFYLDYNNLISLPGHPKSLLSSYQLQCENIQTWFKSSVQVENQAKPPQKSCTQFCTTSIESSIADLNQFLSVNFDMKKLAILAPFSANFLCFSLTRQEMSSINYKALLLCQFFNIILQRHFNKQTPISEFANTFAYTMKYANSIKKIQKQEQFYDIISYLLLLQNLDFGVQLPSTSTSFSTKNLLTNLIDVDENLANSLIQIMKFRNLQFSALFLLVQVVRMLNSDGSINAIQSIKFIDFDDFAAPEIREIYKKLQGKINFKTGNKGQCEVYLMYSEFKKEFE